MKNVALLLVSLAACSDAASDPTTSTPPTDAGSPGDANGPDGPKLPPHVAGDCAGLGPVGTWENITPPGADLTGFGFSHVTVVPNEPSKVYATGDRSSLWRSTDCGKTWTAVNTGTMGKELEKGTMAIVLDPSQPNVMFTGSLYGPNGLFKSTNGGVNWAESLTPEVKKYAPYGGFVGAISMDPDDPKHLLVAWHAECAAPYTKSCYAETTDSGVTWTLRNGDPSWAGGEGSALQFLTSDRWLFSSSSNGMWLSVDRGKTWNKVQGAQISHGAGGRSSPAHRR